MTWDESSFIVNDNYEDVVVLYDYFRNGMGNGFTEPTNSSNLMLVKHNLIMFYHHQEGRWENPLLEAAGLELFNTA